MDTSIDLHGVKKTEVVPKKQIKAIIQTVRDRVEGKIYVLPARRVLDEINYATGFIAVTDAMIYDGGDCRKVDFVAVNVNQIVWMVEIMDDERLGRE